MPPPRASSADRDAAPSPEQLAQRIGAFLTEHPDAWVLEGGKAVFDLRAAQYKLSSDHGRCTLHLWSAERSVVRTIVAAAADGSSLRLTARRLGQAQPRRMDLVAATDARVPKRTATARDRERNQYQKTLERLLPRFFPGWQGQALRTAMDLERSFGPAYVRGTLVPTPQGLAPGSQALGSQASARRAWALVAVGEQESAAIIEGALTVGILWLDHCRKQGDGRVLYEGLKLIVPRGMGLTAAARMAWLSSAAGGWELWEMDRAREELAQRDLDDQGNLRTRLVHHPDESAAQERFARAVGALLEIVPGQEQHRVEQRLRSSSELAFLLHGLEFARACVEPAAQGFRHEVRLTVGVAPHAVELSDATRDDLRELVADLFERRRAAVPVVDYGARARQMSGRIGSASASAAAHSRLNLGTAAGRRRLPASQDPLYRAAPEKWLESVLRANVAPLTRGLAPRMEAGRGDGGSCGDDDDARGNRAQETEPRSPAGRGALIPRLDPRHLYAQVSAIAGAGDKGRLDLLGITEDHRLAVIEIKADDDMHFALQGLDYWIRVRHHHRAAPDAATGLGAFHGCGYFAGVELSPLDPRLFLVAPALRIHPATEVVLRYLSPRVEWELLALDERWRQQVRVVWRRSGGRRAPVAGLDVSRDCVDD